MFARIALCEFQHLEERMEMLSREREFDIEAVDRDNQVKVMLLRPEM